MNNFDFPFAAGEVSTETATQIRDKKNPRRHVPACACPAGKTAVPAGESRRESPPPSPTLLEPQQLQWLFEHNANVGEAKVTSAQPRQEGTCSGRERLKRHRDEVAGRVPIPDSWGQESLLKDWMDYSTFDSLLAPKGIASAREALMAEGRRRQRAAPHQRLRIEGRC